MHIIILNSLDQNLGTLVLYLVSPGLQVFELCVSVMKHRPYLSVLTLIRGRLGSKYDPQSAFCKSAKLVASKFDLLAESLRC